VLRVVLSIFFVLLTSPLYAGEIVFLGGYGVTNNPVQNTGAWQVRYMEGLGEHFAYSLSYVNQGHFISHHRDGNAANLWLRTNMIDKQLILGIGAGPIFYYDTDRPPAGAPADIHGWGTMVNLLASWYTKNRWIYQLQGSWVKGGANSFDTLSVLAGIGYQLDSPPSPGPDLKAPRQTEETTKNELTVFGGQTVVNIPGDGTSAAGSIEYRRGLWRYVEWTAGVLYEGRSILIDRHGLTTQLWVAKPFFDDRLALGTGFGFYLAEDSRREQRTIVFSEIVSLTASYRLSPHWLIRSTWDRIVADYDRDSDVFLAGIGYRF